VNAPLDHCPRRADRGFWKISTAIRNAACSRTLAKVYSKRICRFSPFHNPGNLPGSNPTVRLILVSVMPITRKWSLSPWLAPRSTNKCKAKTGQCQLQYNIAPGATTLSLHGALENPK
jgi:hypothetical protein